MSWEELYPIVKEQAHFAILRYEEPERRRDKIQELVCQSFEKYQRDITAKKEIKKQDYKCFVTQRSKELDKRSICKKGFGGTSSIDALSYFRHRSDSPTPIIEFDEWMAVTQRTKENIEANMAFSVDYKSWLEKLSDLHKRILDYLIQGFQTRKISEMINIAVEVVKKIIKELKRMFIEFFEIRIA
ncbi:MAG: hypothetical protein ACYDEE_00570 [Ignavibacteriaceae bacterium]